MAVLKFSGLTGDERVAQQTERLEALVRCPSAHLRSPRYDPPLTPWFMRRNEAVVPVSAELLGEPRSARLAHTVWFHSMRSVGARDLSPRSTGNEACNKTDHSRVGPKSESQSTEFGMLISVCATVLLGEQVHSQHNAEHCASNEACCRQLPIRLSNISNMQSCTHFS